MVDFLSVNEDVLKIELLFIGERLPVSFVALTVLIATFSFICHPPFCVDVEHYKMETSRLKFLRHPTKISLAWP